MKIFLCVILLSFFEAKGQKPSPQLSTEILKFYDRAADIYGVVFIDTVYNKCDTTELRKYFPGKGLGNNLAVVGLLKMKCIDFSFSSISTELKNIISIDSFFRMKERKPDYTPYELVYNKKLDSVLNFINLKRGNNGELSEDLKEIEKLLTESSYWDKSMESQKRMRKKLLKVLSIFESKEYFLIVYTVSELHGTLHTTPYYELIIK